ncbi:MAG TPA: hypothetical protein VJP02_16055 [Candidatus Sulfotelmatobacter sp.]|nr:hypothetical protein [Candidatus Sulfotelmatobacter sp.]
MRRLIPIAAFALLLSVPLWAQRGGGHGGGGHAGGMHAGGLAGHAGGGHIGGGRSFGGVHSGGTTSRPGFSRGFNQSFNRGFSRVPFRDRGFRDHRRHDFDRFGFRNNCFGFACRNWGWSSPWWGWGGYDPWLWSSWDDEDRRFDEDYYRQYEIANEWNQQNLEQQRMMRQEESDGDQDAYAPRTSERRPAYDSASQPQEPVAQTVLVYHDQHREEVSNYAIVGQTLWSFTGQRTKKIPLADLDIAATQRANDDRGVTFRAPGAAEGQ